MTNQGESKNRNHINTGVSFKFIHYMADLLGWDYIMLYCVSLTNKRQGVKQDTRVQLQVMDNFIKSNFT